MGMNIFYRRYKPTYKTVLSKMAGSLP